MVALPPQTIMHGNPPNPTHQVVQAKMKDWMQEFESISAGGGLSYVDGTLSALNARTGTTDGQFGLVLSTLSEAGVYERVAGVWTKVASIPAIFTESLAAIEAAASAAAALISENASALSETNSAASANTSAIEAANAAAAALAAGAAIYSDTTAGLAATSNGDLFFVPDAGILKIYENQLGVAVEQASTPITNRRRVYDVAALIADTTLVYATGEAGTTLAGDVIETEVGGFLFKATVSGASDQHVTTAGGMKLYVLPDASGVSWTGAIGATSNAARTSALQALLAYTDVVGVSGAEYDHLTVTQSNKRIIMDRGVTFKIPDGTSTSGNTTGIAVFGVAGDNVRIVGAFTVDGNRANNDSTNVVSADRTGAIYVTGNGVEFADTVTIDAAYYHGFVVDGGLTSGGEVTDFSAKKIVVNDPDFYGVMLWGMDRFDIGRIEIIGGTPGIGRDPRLRTGTQNSGTTTKTKNGKIGSFYGSGGSSCVVEKSTDTVDIGSVISSGGKLEDCSNINVGSWLSTGFSSTNTGFAFGLLTSTNCHIGSLMVKDYDCDFSAPIPAVAFAGSDGCSIGSIIVDGNTANSTNDIRIRNADGLKIDYIKLYNSLAPIGFLYDHNNPTQRDIFIGSLISRGHPTWDVTIQTKDRDVFHVAKINGDATLQFPLNTAYLDHEPEYDVFSPTLTTTGTDFSSVTYHSARTGQYSKHGRLVTVGGFMRTDSITVGSASGNVAIGNLPYPISSGIEFVFVGSLTLASGWVGDVPMNITAEQGTSKAALTYRTAVNGDDSFVAVSDVAIGPASNSTRFSLTYLTD